MPTVNIPSQLVVQTAAQWAADATVYSAKRILITSDAFYGATDQRQFKISDGVQTWAQLDYMPIGVAANASETVAGIVEEATQAELNAGTDTGATGAKLFAVPSKILSLLGSYLTTASAAATYQTISGLFASVLGLVLTGFVAGANTAVAATDTIAQALSKFQGQINARATLSSPSLTGTPTAPTAAPGDNSQQLANTAFVQQELAGIGGDWELVSSASAAASATIDFSLSSTYHAFCVIISNLIPATDTASLYTRTSTDGGSTFDAGAGNYRHSRFAVPSSGAIFSGQSNSATEIILAGSLGSNTGETLDAHIWLVKPSAATYCKVIADVSYLDSGAVFERLISGGVRLASADVDAIRFLMSTGNIASGEFRLYGIKNA